MLPCVLATQGTGWLCLAAPANLWAFCRLLSLSSWYAESRGVILLGVGTYGTPRTRRSVLAGSMVSTATTTTDAVRHGLLGSLLSSSRVRGTGCILCVGSNCYCRIVGITSLQGPLLGYWPLGTLGIGCDGRNCNNDTACTPSPLGRVFGVFPVSPCCVREYSPEE